MQILRSCSSKVTLVAVLAGLGLVHAALAADATAPAATSSAMADSVTTVDTLIKSENREALARASERAIAAGLATAPAAHASKAPGAAAPQIVVFAIYGIEGDLRASMAFNTDIYENVRKGVRVGPCVIRSIDDRLITLAPAGKRGSPGQCPSVKWTGILMVPPAPLATLATTAPGAAAGLPSPAVPTPFSSVGGPPIGFQAPALRANPPVAQGQGAASLIPRQVEATTDPRLEQPAATN